MSSSTSSSDPPTPGGAGGGATRGYLGWWAATTLVGLALLTLFNWAVDPLQIYRPAVPGSAIWSENQRYQIPGIVKHRDYETIVVGTSHAENFLPSLVASHLGERAVKLAISGSTAREQRLVVEKALSTGRVRHVLWVLDRIAFGRPPGALGRAGDDFPLHLYREDATTPLLYLLSTDTFVLGLERLLGRGHRDLDSLNAWHADHAFGEGPVLADWRRRLAVLAALRAQPSHRFVDPTAITRRSITVNLLPPIRTHPEVRFDLIFPPYAMLSYLADLARHPAAFEARQRYKADVVRATAALPNVRVFDFQGIESISRDFGHFKDLEHFDLRVNALILSAVAAGAYEVDPDRYAEQLAAQARQVRSFRDEVCAPGSGRRALCPDGRGARGPR